MRFFIWPLFALAAGLPADSLAQDDHPWIEVQYHRVFLRNGNFLDGKVIKITDKEIVLRLPPGDMRIRMDQVDRVELVKMKSLNEKGLVLSTPSSPPPAGPSKRPSPVPRAGSSAAEAVKLDPQTDEAVQSALEEYSKADIEGKQTILTRLIGMGGKVPAYLISTITRFGREQMAPVLSTIAQTKDAQLVPYFASHLSSDDAALRMNVVLAMGLIGSPECVQPLNGALKDKDGAVRAAAVAAVSLIGSPYSMDGLYPLLEDPDRDTRTRAIGALSDLATKHNKQKDLSDALGAAISRTQGDTREDLVFAAGHGGHTGLWTQITPLLREDATGTRLAAAKALAELGVHESAEAIQAAVSQENTESVRIALARAVQKIGIRGCGGTLIEWLERGGPELQGASRLALSSLAGENLGDDLNKWKEWWQKSRPQ